MEPAQKQQKTLKGKVLHETMKELLKKKVLELNQKRVSENTCVNCGEKYSPSQNHNEACVFHPGALRYFYCKGCGADAYYQFCSRCKSCSHGCKITNHCSQPFPILLSYSFTFPNNSLCLLHIYYYIIFFLYFLHIEKIHRGFLAYWKKVHQPDFLLKRSEME